MRHRPTRPGTPSRSPLLVALASLGLVLTASDFGAAVPQIPMRAFTSSTEPAPVVEARALVAELSLVTPTEARAAEHTGTTPGREPLGGDEATDVPWAALTAYQRAEDIIAEVSPSCGLRWTLLAGVGHVETEHGELDGSDLGPLQLTPAIWRVAGVDGDADGKRSAADVDDAALAVAVFLCAIGGDLAGVDGQTAALTAYNPTQGYVDRVRAAATTYDEGDYTVVDAPAAPVQPAVEAAVVAGDGRAVTKHPKEVLSTPSSDSPSGDSSPERQAEPKTAQGPHTRTQPAESAESTEPREPKEPTPPAEPAEPREPAQAETSEPSETSEPADTPKPADPADPADAAEPAEPAEPADPADSGEPGEPADPADPADPAEPEPATEALEPLVGTLVACAEGYCLDETPLDVTGLDPTAVDPTEPSDPATLEERLAALVGEQVEVVVEGDGDRLVVLELGLLGGRADGSAVEHPTG